MEENRKIGQQIPHGSGVVSDPISPQLQSVQSNIGSTGSNTAVNGASLVEVPISESSTSGRKRSRSQNPNPRFGMIYIEDEDDEEEQEENDENDEDYSIDRRGNSFRNNRRNPIRRSRRRRRRRRSNRLTIRTPRVGRTDQESTKRTTISWLIDSGSVPLNGQVCYMDWTSKRALLDGKITRDGILCSCCSNVVTVSEFEAHAGSNAGQPYQSIFLDKNMSLLQCQINSWNQMNRNSQPDYVDPHERTRDLNDDTCCLCGDGGNLICCDSCPSTYHQNCLGIEVLPLGNWYCPLCLCKFCGIRGFNDAQWNKCHQCEEKYHPQCHPENEGTISDENGLNFCGQSCKQLFEQLQKLIGVRHELESGLTWSMIRCLDQDSTASFSGLYARMQWNSTLAVTLAVMRECFLPIVDQRTGVNVIEHIIFNRRLSLSRLNFTQFYTMILERGDEIVAAASVRMHGTRLAEMPFIGTRSIYRRQGMCHRLLDAIQYVLRSLSVGKLIIPSIAERAENWVKEYGFEPVDEPLKHELRSLNLLMFPDTVQLQKPLKAEETNAVAVQRNGRALLDLNIEPPDEDEANDNGSNDRRHWGYFLTVKPGGPVEVKRVLLPSVSSFLHGSHTV